MRWSRHENGTILKIIILLVVALGLATGCTPELEVDTRSDDANSQKNDIKVGTQSQSPSQNPDESVDTETAEDIPNRGQTEENPEESGLSVRERLLYEQILLRAEKAGLSEEQLLKLAEAELVRSFDGRNTPGIILPSYIPYGFTVDTISVGNSSPDGGLLYYYEIVYRTRDRRFCFATSHYTYNGDNMGDGPEQMEVFTVPVPGLGIQSLNVGYTNFSQNSNTASLFFSIVGQINGEGPYFYNFKAPAGCDFDLNLEEAIKVITSFQHLTPQPTFSLDSFSNEVIPIVK